MENVNSQNSNPHNPEKDEIPDDKNNEENSEPSDPDTDSDDGVDLIIVDENEKKPFKYEEQIPPWMLKDLTKQMCKICKHVPVRANGASNFCAPCEYKIKTRAVNEANSTYYAVQREEERIQTQDLIYLEARKGKQENLQKMECFKVNSDKRIYRKQESGIGPNQLINFIKTESKMVEKKEKKRKNKSEPSKKKEPATKKSTPVVEKQPPVAQVQQAQEPAKQSIDEKVSSAFTGLSAQIENLYKLQVKDRNDVSGGFAQIRKYLEDQQINQNALSKGFDLLQANVISLQKARRKEEHFKRIQHNPNKDEEDEEEGTISELDRGVDELKKMGVSDKMGVTDTWDGVDDYDD